MLEDIYHALLKNSIGQCHDGWHAMACMWNITIGRYRNGNFNHFQKTARLKCVNIKSHTPHGLAACGAEAFSLATDLSAQKL